MRLTRLFIVITVLLVGLACLTDNPLTDPGTSSVTLNINLPSGEGIPDTGTGLAKAMAITSVTVTVTADDMEDIEESLDISEEIASGTLEVPRGEDRTFAVECQDANGILQYSGSDTTDILEKSVTVEITTEGHYPSASTLTITSFDAVSVTLSWTKNADADFASYELVRAGSADDIASASTRESIVTITSQNTTTYTDDSVSPNTTYYYAIIVWDTEGMGMRSAPEGVLTPQLVEISYDDGIWEDNNWGDEVGDRYDQMFIAPSYPCYIRSVKLFLRDKSGTDGNYQIYIQDSGANDIFLSEPLATVSSTATDAGDWVNWTISWGIRTDGTVADNFYVGIRYTSNRLWPDIFFDVSSWPLEAWHYDASTETWTEIFDVPSIRAYVEIGGSLLKGPSGQVVARELASATFSLAKKRSFEPEGLTIPGPELVAPPCREVILGDRQPLRPARAMRPSEKLRNPTSREKPTRLR